VTWVSENQVAGLIAEGSGEQGPSPVLYVSGEEVGWYIPLQDAGYYCLVVVPNLKHVLYMLLLVFVWNSTLF
jgi:hypothetical protein